MTSMQEIDHQLLSKAIDVIGNEKGAVHWLQTPKTALGNQVPIKIAETDEGKQKVLALLGRIEHGVFS
jgi:putative toxin-antitoxin system antitoxin component (TIGR02293 family)